jgi:actin-like ATPase involved in cell morphogenesis
VSYVLGIDLGTTYTGVALGRDGRVEMVGLGDRSLVVPAVVFAHEGGPLVTGDAAARRALDQPGRSARQFKRRLGDPTPLLLGGAPYSPAILMAAVLRAVVDQAVELNGEPPERIVLTRPAVWGPYRREQFDEVPNLSGLAGVTMVSEPVAAATYYAATGAHQDGEVIAVYDLGGGTFDATVVRLVDGDVQILGDPNGVEWLGGIDFDEAVLGYVDEELKGAVTALDLSDPQAARLLLRLRQECILAKEALSLEPEVSVPVVLPSGTSSVRLTRTAFEARIRPALMSTVETLQRVLASADLTPADVSAIRLVGGSSRIPLVSTLLAAELHRPIVVDSHPKHAVALGAALIAGRPVPTPDGPAEGRAVITHRPSPAPTPRPGGRRLLAGLVALLVILTGGTLAALSARAPSTPTTLPKPVTIPVVSKIPNPTTEPPTPSPTRSATARSITRPPVNASFDYQIGGAYPPQKSVEIVVRDRDDPPAPGKYNICYINAFQTQAEDEAFWTGSHADLLLKTKDGKYFSDPDYPREYLLDISSKAQRTAVARILDDWIDDCAQKGYKALDPDNQDSWTRSKGQLSQTDNVAMATLLTAHAHAAGLAVAQRNTPELGSKGRTTAKFDFAIVEECQFYQECDVYLETYGGRVYEIEYTDHPRRAYVTACANQGRRISVTLRDRDVVPQGEPGYHDEHC